MNNYCRNCGEKLENDSKVCPKCNAEVFENRVNAEQAKAELEEYKKKEKKYIITIISLYAASYLPHLNIFSDSKIFSYISSLLFFAATILLIYARITMPKSKKTKNMFNIFIAFLVASFVFTTIIIITCANLIKGCY